MNRVNAEPRPVRLGYALLRLLLAFFVSLAGGLVVLVGGTLPAYAAGDQIDEFAITYQVQPSGVLRVTETIVLRFGDTSGRHGLQRWYVTREPYDDQQDAVYRLTNIEITSPDPGVATEWQRTDDERNDGREVRTRLRIGDPDETISTDTATYVISYDLTGALRSFTGYDEFYWDATGYENPLINQLSIQATVPGGAQDVSCFAGPPGSKNTCQSADFTQGGPATFAQSNIPAGQGVSIGVKITQGLIVDNKPHLEPDGSKLSPGARIAAIVGAGVAALIAIGSPIVGVLWWRKNGRDQRYAGLAPGTIPLAGQEAHIVPHDPDLPIPVAFSPPRIPVAEAGLLIDGQVDTRETAGTIIDLAVRGALTVQSDGDDDFRVTLVDPNRAAAPHEMVLLTTLFGGGPPGTQVDLSERGSLTSAHQAMQTSVRNQVTSRGWFRKAPSAATAGSFGFGAVMFIVFGAFAIGAVLLWVLVPLLPIIITVAVIRTKLRRGQRTADGRAVCDQVEGFRTYLATAEADQLKFEEGEDIFSRYLPWAIIFELADRWARICADLVAMGRIPDTTPYWYYGNYNILNTAATPVPSSGSSGSGFGGGSSFGGGGFSGGGGGGGGSSSW
jgi:uncharacterized membrane protein YgcG